MMYRKFVNAWVFIRFTYFFLIHFRKVKGILIEECDSIWQKSMFYGALTRLPDKVLMAMQNKKVRIWYSNQIRFKGLEGKSFDGFYHPDEQIIYVNNEGFLDWNKHVKILYHEIGHFVDYSLGSTTYMSLQDKEFATIFVQEQVFYDYYPGGYYYIESKAEYFAESFALSFFSPEFQEECKHTKEYIEKTIDLLSL